MGFLTDKHVVVALLAAPVLALGAYFAASFVVETPTIKAGAGDSFPLAAKSNCRRPSPVCTLANGDVKIDLRQVSAIDINAIGLEVQSDLPVEGARFALVDGAGNEVQSGESAGGVMAIDAARLQEAVGLRLVVQLAGTLYFAETAVTFLTPAA